jgi:hypothetical protein
MFYGESELESSPRQTLLYWVDEWWLWLFIGLLVMALGACWLL